MTLKSALQDVRETTLAAVCGLLGKLAYLASLRGSQGRYQHWGMEAVHGVESSERALNAAHAEVLAGVLRTSLPALEKDLSESSQESGFGEGPFVERLQNCLPHLMPSGRKDAPSATHLNSVLAALSRLQKARGRATRSTS